MFLPLLEKVVNIINFLTLSAIIKNIIQAGIYDLFTKEYRKYIKEKSKQRYYYNYLPRSVSEAFTLAEILTVLVIVSLIVAIGIPDLINSINEQEYNSSVKKIYSVLSQAIQNIQNNNGTVRIGNGTDIVASTNARDDFCSVMQCIKTDTANNTFNTSYSWYKGASTLGLKDPSKATTVLSDGTYLFFDSYANCTGGALHPCGTIYVDTNGVKPPNMNGDDLHIFWVVLNNGVYSVLPVGSSLDGQSCVAGGSGVTSQGCTYQRIINPDKMP